MAILAQDLSHTYKRGLAQTAEQSPRKRSGTKYASVAQWQSRSVLETPEHCKLMR